jgi:ferredoxin
VVIGGGFTAVDCARTALRLGARTVKVFYRRSEKEMYITPSEIEEMKHEGIAFDTLVSPRAYVGAGGRLNSVRLVCTELGEPDASGRCRPVEVAGSEFEVAADTVLLATGQYQDTSCLGAGADGLLDEEGALKSGRDPRTVREGLFVAGDFACGADSLIDAIGHAKTCARAVDRHLTGHDRLADVVRISDAPGTGRTRAMDEIPRQPMRTEPLDRRGLTDEVERGFDAEAARTEARRCYLCHYKFEIDNELCIYCDRCLKVMPVDHCIVKVRSLRYDDQGVIVGHKPSKSARDYNLLYIDQNECIRCGACAEVCPVECITLQKVTGATIPAGELNRALQP